MSAGRTVPWTFCPRCYRAVMVLRDPAGMDVAVDPEPIVGGRLVVNGVAARIVGTIPTSGAGSGEVGWRRHVELCPLATAQGMARVLAADWAVTA